ncbi:MAG: cobalamin-dependent protein, partial [Magnetospirillum sp.]|nr:cobalamin-dependent protein [Magnetospirillum sp.]
MDETVSVGLVQINNSFSGQSYLPYSVACLEGYVRRHAPTPSRYRFLLPVYKRVPVHQAVAQLLEADVVGFSTYVWNGRISLEIARRLKAAKPGIVIIFGGPHVPDATEDFLRRHPFIDVAVNGEGEQAFLEVLERLPSGNWDGIPGLSHLDPQGRFVQVPKGPRLNDLAQIPSPFLEDLFAPLMQANPDETWIGLWETNRGCPFQCTYCDWGSATAAKLGKFEMDRLLAEAEWFSRHRIEFIFCCDANFGILPRDIELAEHVARLKRETGYPTALSVQNTKNATERAYATQKILSDAGLSKGVALSMQTLDGGVLKAIKRDNISLETYLELQRRFTRDKVETFSDLILGLPGETYESFISGIDTLITTGQHNRIQFNNLSILPNAEMAAPAYIHEHGLVTIDSEIINIHGSRVTAEDDVAEVQQLVVATATLPPQDWRRVRAVSSISV